MTWLVALTFEEKVSVLHGAHFLMSRFLDYYFGESHEQFALRHGDALKIHLHLRLLIEDILNEEGFGNLRSDYFCPLESLHEIHPMSWIDWTRKDRASVNRFQSKVSELYMRTGRIPLSKLEMFARLFEDLERLLERYMSEVAPDYQKLLAGIDKEFSWLLAHGRQESRAPEQKAGAKSHRSRAEGNGRGPRRNVKPLSHKEKIGLLYEAHAAMINLLDCYFRGLLRGSHKNVTDIHLRLRLLIEDLVSDEEFEQLKKRYVCPFETLSGIEDRSMPFSIEIKSDRWASSRPKMEGFQGRLAELHIRAGSPGLPSREPYKAIVNGLRSLFAHVRFYSGPDLYDLSDEELERSTRQTRKLIKEILAGLAAIDLHGKSVRQAERGSATPSVSAEERKDIKKHKYKCLDKIRIPGAHPEDGVNTIYVNSGEVRLSDKLLALLVRLVIELKKGKGGWVDRDTLSKEKIGPDQGHQIYTRLRKKLEPHLLKPKGRDLIENDGKGYYRLSIPPGFVIYDESKLRRHPTRDVRAVAKRLRPSPRPKK